MPIPVFVEFRGGLGNLHAAIGRAEADIQRLGRSSATSMQKAAVVGKYAAGAILATGAAVSVASIKMAADFQSQVMHLQTDAGESGKNMKMISDGILSLAGATGTSTKNLVSGMYYIESAGYHGAAGLTVLKAAAEGAKVGNADLTTVSDALTTALNSYHLGAGGATMVTNELIATVSSGKTKLEDLSGSLGTVLPAAATAKIGLDQVLGAMATMTAQGTNAHLAATYLRQTILQLENPTAKAAAEMRALGLSSIDISKNLGKRGLTGTFDVLTSAIERKMGPAGVVLIDSLKKAAGHTTAFQKILANLPPTQQTYVAALANMTGGTKSMQAALELTGGSSKTFAKNVQTIGAVSKDTSGKVKDWDVIQKTFNQKIDRAKGYIEAFAIKLGTKLIPIVEKVISDISATVKWFEKHRVAVVALASAVGVILVPAITLYTISMAEAAVATLLAMWPILAIMAAAALLGAGIYELATHWSTVWKFIKRITLDVWHAIEFASGHAMQFIITDVILPITNAFLTWAATIVGAAATAFGWIPGIGPKLKDAKKTLDNFKTTTDATLSTMATNASTWGSSIGANVAGGLASGIDNNTGQAVAAGARLAGATAAAIRTALRVRSPSRLTMELGRFVAEGLALGMTANAGVVGAAAASLGRAATPPISTPYRGGRGGQTTPRLHPDDIRALADAMTGLTVHMDGQKVGMVVRGNLLAAQKTRGLRIGLA